MYCVIYPSLRGNIEELDFNIPLLRMIYCSRCLIIPLYFSPHTLHFESCSSCRSLPVSCFYCLSLPGYLSSCNTCPASCYACLNLPASCSSWHSLPADYSFCPQPSITRHWARPKQSASCQSPVEEKRVAGCTKYLQDGDRILSWLYEWSMVSQW